MKDVQKITFCGVFGALALSVMLMGGLLSVFVYLSPALAGMLILPVVYETDRRTGWLVYLVLSLLALILVPDKELVAMFILLFGYYPLLKFTLDRIRPFLLRLVIKLAIFNAAVFAAYFILLKLFAMDALASEFSEFTHASLLLLLALANLTFCIYDIAVARLSQVYLKVLRPRILKGSQTRK